GEVRRSVSDYRLASDVFHREFRPPHIGAELPRRLLPDHLVSITVTGHLVARSSNPADHARISSGHLAKNEKGPRSPGLFEKLQNSLHAVRNATRKAAALHTTGPLLEDQRMVVFLDVDRHGVQHPSPHRDSLPNRMIFAVSKRICTSSRSEQWRM